MRPNWNDCIPFNGVPDSICERLASDNKNAPFTVYFTTKLPRGFIDPKDKRFNKVEKAAYKINRSAFWSKNFELELVLMKFRTFVIYVPKTADDIAPAIYVCNEKGEIVSKLEKKVTSKSLLAALYPVLIKINKEIKPIIKKEQALVKKIIDAEDDLIKIKAEREKKQKMTASQLDKMAERVSKANKIRDNAFSAILRRCPPSTNTNEK